MTTGFPALDADILTALKQSIDQGFLAFSQRHGAAIEAACAPLQDLLIGAEQALLATPWPLLLAALAVLAWGASRRWPLALCSTATLAVLGLFGLWDDTLKTLAMVLVATALAVALVVRLIEATGSASLSSDPVPPGAAPVDTPAPPSPPP